VYAWLEKTRFEDLPYLDERVKKDGPGHSGVYRTKLGTGKVELLATMDRPNGIGFTYARDLIVSECCQGTHNPRCPQGTSRWVAFKQSPSNGSDWRRHAVVDDVLDTATAGCADGFAVVDRPYPLLLATCAGGLCIVCHPNPNPPRVYASMCTPQRMSPPAPSLMTVRVAGTGRYAERASRREAVDPPTRPWLPAKQRGSRWWPGVLNGGVWGMVYPSAETCRSRSLAAAEQRERTAS
jgi:hypothetical protein